MNTPRRASFSQSAAWETSAASTHGVRARRTLEKPTASAHPAVRLRNSRRWVSGTVDSVLMLVGPWLTLFRQPPPSWSLPEAYDFFPNDFKFLPRQSDASVAEAVIDAHLSGFGDRRIRLSGKEFEVVREEIV